MKFLVSSFWFLVSKTVTLARNQKLATKNEQTFPTFVLA